MEMPELEIPAVFSKMLQMFPNIPQDIIWRYVQQYASDVEKCAQMLNLQNGKYTGLPSTTTLQNRKNLNESNNIQPSYLIMNSRTIIHNGNDVEENNECDEQSEHTSYDSHSSYAASLASPNIEENTSTDTSPDANAAIKFSEPLILNIVPDDEGISHSWRPSNSDDVVCPDLFLPPPVTENFQLSTSEISNRNFEQNSLEFHINPKAGDVESGRYSMVSQVSYNYPLPDWRNSGKDITSYLHYQRSQMNAVRYEVIKAKIELSDIKESIENLEKDLKEKEQSKRALNIIDLKKEIEQLGLDCQCLYSEIDETMEDPILLGDVDEKLCIKNESPPKNADIQCTAAVHNANEISSSDSQEESNKWQCRECTFANHPAINVCEMCQLPKSATRRPSFLPRPSNSCYCHPQDSALPLRS